MKRIVSFALTVFMLLTLVVCFVSCSKDGEAHMGFKIITTDINDFVLEVPDTWTVTSQNAFVSATVEGAAGDESNVSMMSSQRSANETTPEAYFDKLIESYGDMYENIVVESRDVEIELGSEKAKKYVFGADVLGESYKFMQVICIHGDRVYIFTYTSNDEFYAEHEMEIKYILDYFYFKV